MCSIVPVERIEILIVAHRGRRITRLSIPVYKRSAALLVATYVRSLSYRLDNEERR